jgi:hypothetical protein
MHETALHFNHDGRCMMVYCTHKAKGYKTAMLRGLPLDLITKPLAFLCKIMVFIVGLPSLKAQKNTINIEQAPEILSPSMKLQALKAGCLENIIMQPHKTCLWNLMFS